MAILISAGKDATAEFDKIHPTHMIDDDDAPDAIIGTLGAGDVDDDEEDDSAEGLYTLDEVANHTRKGETSGAPCTDVSSTFPISCPCTMAASCLS